MARLTEEMVVARSRQSDLSSVKKLNCWGAELGDVSLLRRMPNVEVLALSVNKIASLADFAHCPRLKELYIRRNLVAELAEIRHLRTLPRLTNLWLEENPCTEHPNYRMTVLRNLPNLQKLDNIAVQPEEVEEAMRKGTPIADPDDEYYQQESYPQYARAQRSPESSPDRLAERAEPHEYRRDQGSDCPEGAAESSYPEPLANGCRESPPSAQISPTRHRNYSPERDDERYEHPVASRGQRYYEREEAPERSRLRHASSTDEPPERAAAGIRHSQSAQSVKREEAPERSRLRHASSTDEPPERAAAGIRHSQSAQSVKQDYPSTNGDSHRQRASPQYGERHSADLQPYRETYAERAERPEPYHQVPRCPLECDRESSKESLSRRERDGDIPSAVMAEHRGFTRRPVTRNSNLLSAVLCLVKELDYPSLEVAEMAVRCRMDELASQP